MTELTTRNLLTELDEKVSSETYLRETKRGTRLRTIDLFLLYGTTYCRCVSAKKNYPKHRVQFQIDDLS